MAEERVQHMHMYNMLTKLHPELHLEDAAPLATGGRHTSSQPAEKVKKTPAKLRVRRGKSKSVPRRRQRK